MVALTIAATKHLQIRICAAPAQQSGEARRTAPPCDSDARRKRAGVAPPAGRHRRRVSSVERIEVGGVRHSALCDHDTARRFAETSHLEEVVIIGGLANPHSSMTAQETRRAAGARQSRQQKHQPGYSAKAADFSFAWLSQRLRIVFDLSGVSHPTPTVPGIETFDAGIASRNSRTTTRPHFLSPHGERTSVVTQPRPGWRS
jgi:hypothetical protein